MKITRTLLVSLVAPGVVCLLVAVQIAFGLRGFDAPRGGLAAILEVPGMLVGWGSLLFLGPLLIWLVLDWWGVSFSGIALKCLGATAVAIAIGAMFGVVGGIAAGGHLGSALGQMLSSSLGMPVTFALLTVMALPGLVLTCIGFLKHAPTSTARAPRSSDLASPRTAEAPLETTASEPPPASTPASTARVQVEAPRKQEKAEKNEKADDEPKKRSPLFRRRKKVSNLADLVRDSAKRVRPAGEPWYPPSQYDAQGNELPMDFGEHRDVGGIRFADPLEDEAEVEQAPDTVESGAGRDEDAPAETDSGPDAADADGAASLPTIPELFAGAYDAEALETALDDDKSSEAASDGSASSETDRPSAPSGADRLADPSRVVEGVGRVVGSAEATEETLMPGVRWADAEAPTERSRIDAETRARQEAEGRVHDRLVSEVGRIPARLDDDADEPELDDADVEDEDVALGEVMAQTPSPAVPTEEEEAPSVRDSVLQALEGQAHNQSSQRYMEKLEASGIFDFMQDEDEPSAASKAKDATRKKRATKKAPAKKATKKKTSKKKAQSKKAPAKKTTKKKARKQTPKKKAPTKKAPKKKTARKKTTRKKKTGARTKQNAERRPSDGPASKRKPATRPEPDTQTQVKSEPAVERPPAAPTEQWRTGTWRQNLGRSGTSGIEPTAARPEVDPVSAEVRRAVIRERRDPQFTRAAELCLDRGAASPVLLTRRLGVSFAEAKSLVQRLCRVGVLGAMTPTGSHPTAMTREIWDEASR